MKMKSVPSALPWTLNGQSSHWLSRFLPLQMAFKNSCYMHLRHFHNYVLSLLFVSSRYIEFLKSAQQAVNDDAW